MNPTNKEVAGLESITLATEQVVPTTDSARGEASLSGAERSPAGAERVLQPTTQLPATSAVSTIPLPLPPQSPLAAAPPAAAIDTASVAALPADDDNDLIEKEWVNKAKQIVERTRNDPHKQSEYLTVFKADYIKKRYGKTIKVSQ